MGRKLIDITIDIHETGSRFDNLVVARTPGISRSLACKLIRQGELKIDNLSKKPGYRVSAGQKITGYLPESEQPDFLPEPVDLDIIYLDDHCIVINKPPKLVVHPAPGHYSGTLAHGLLHRFPELKDVGAGPGRPGIVHRLDQDTSGILLAARSASAYLNLTSQFKERTVRKSYIALVYGEPGEDAGRITLPIARHPANRKKMKAAEGLTGRQADTRWKVLRRFGGVSLVEFDIMTGRTHQIRVHANAMGHPVVGDEIYGFRNPIRSFGLNRKTAPLVKKTARQMLHAWKLSFKHPETGLEMKLEATIPDDMTALIKALEIAAEEA